MYDLWVYVVWAFAVLGGWGALTNDDSSGSDKFFGVVLLGACGIGVVVQILDLIYANVEAIKTFFSYVFYTVIIVAGIAATLYGINYYKDYKAEEEAQTQQFLLEQQEQREKQEAEQARKEQAEREALTRKAQQAKQAREKAEKHAKEENRQYLALQGNVQTLTQQVDTVAGKNERLKTEIRNLEYIVSSLDIFDTDFLENYPKVLQYIDEEYQLGRA